MKTGTEIVIRASIYLRVILFLSTSPNPTKLKVGRITGFIPERAVKVDRYALIYGNKIAGALI